MKGSLETPTKILDMLFRVDSASNRIIACPNCGQIITDTNNGCIRCGNCGWKSCEG